MTITVRHSEQADIPAIHGIYSQRSNTACTLQLPYPSLALWNDRLGRHQENFYSLVACAGERVVGQIGIEAMSSPRRRHVANIGLAVDESARRAGVGSALVGAAIELCNDWLAMRRIELETYTDNVPAIGMFRKLGFEIEGTAIGYAFRAGRYVDVHLMALRSNP